MTVDPSDEAPYGGCYYDNSGLYGTSGQLPPVPEYTYTFSAPLTGCAPPDPLNMGIVNNPPSTGVGFSAGQVVTTSVLYPTAPLPVPVGQVFYDPASEMIFVYDGATWNPMVPPAPITEPCASYKGRKARKCNICGYKYVDHSAGQYALLRDRLLAMQQKVREL